MEQVRVNIILERGVWRMFSAMAPTEIIRQEDEKELKLAFREAAKDETRLKAINEW